jgi:hypothetical protein
MMGRKWGLCPCTPSAPLCDKRAHRIERELQVRSYHRKSHTIGLDLLRCVCRSGYPTIPNNKKQLLGSYWWIQNRADLLKKALAGAAWAVRGCRLLSAISGVVSSRISPTPCPWAVIPRGQFCPKATACVMQICSRPSAWHRFRDPCECPNLRACRLLLL